MKRFAFWMGSLACLSLVGAQYFSVGWSPGKPVPSSTSSAPSPEYTPQHTASNGGFLEKLLSSELINRAFSSLGINVTERLQALTTNPTPLWDDRIPLITDDNYGAMIVNETLTAGEEKNRVWFIVVSLSAMRNDAMSHLLDQAFDEAHNQTVIAKDLKHVQWGRIDYMNVTYLTTKWGLWQGPYIVVLKDRGQTLRFYKASQLRIKPDLIRKFLLTDDWKENSPWDSMYAPGGSREWMMEYFALALTKIYNTIRRVPKFVLLFITGGLASFMLSWLHKPSTPGPTARRIAQKPKASVAVPSTSAVSEPAAKPKSDGSKQRKGGKKTK